MNVYTVEIVIPYEDDYVAEIFTSKEKARKYIKSKGYKYSRKEHAYEHWKDYKYAYICKYEVK